MDDDGVLETGSFTTPISGRDTTVRYEIQDTYDEAQATFRFMGTAYTFKMRLWAKTKAFDRFANLTVEKFKDDADVFGSLTITTDDDATTITYARTADQKLNIIKYGIRQVFACAEGIIVSQRRRILDYAVYWLERIGGDAVPAAYEEFVHLMACRCLVHAKFLGPDARFEVDYVDTPQTYKGDAYLGWMVPCDEPW